MTFERVLEKIKRRKQILTLNCENPECLFIGVSNCQSPRTATAYTFFWDEVELAQREFSEIVLEKIDQLSTDVLEAE